MRKRKTVADSKMMYAHTASIPGFTLVSSLGCERHQLRRDEALHVSASDGYCSASSQDARSAL